MNGSGSSSSCNGHASTNGNVTRQYIRNSSSSASRLAQPEVILVEHIEYRESAPITPPPEPGATILQATRSSVVTTNNPSRRVADLEPDFQNNTYRFLSKHFSQRFNAGFGIGLLAGVGLVVFQRYFVKAMK